MLACHPLAGSPTQRQAEWRWWDGEMDRQVSGGDAAGSDSPDVEVRLGDAVLLHAVGRGSADTRGSVLCPHPAAAVVAHSMAAASSVAVLYTAPAY